MTKKEAARRAIKDAVRSGESLTQAAARLAWVNSLTEGQLQFTTGTLYPVLQSLENEAMLEAVGRDAAGGSRRKYYRLTKKGRRHSR